MKEKAIKITSAKIAKEGETNGKKWTIYGFTDHEDIKYSTFEKDVLTAIGRSCRIYYTEEQKEFTNKDGKVIPYTARFVKTIVFDEASMPAEEIKTSMDYDAEIQEIKNRLDKLEFNKDDEVINPDISEDSLPF